MAVLCLWGVIGCTAMSLMQSPFTELLMQRACERQGIPFGSRECDKSAEAQSEATYRSTILAVTGSVAAFASLGVASVMADSFGRKDALTFIMTGNVLSPALVWLIPMDMVHVLGYGFDGFWLIMGLGTLTSLFGVGAYLSVSMSVMADVSAELSHATRTNMLMLLEAATWGGNMVGPILGAKLADVFGLRAVFGFSAGGSLLAIVLLLFFYDETLDPAQRIAFSWKRANPIGQLWPLIAHPLMIKFSVILGPTYLMAMIVNNMIQQLYLIRVIDSGIMELAVLLTINNVVGVVGLLVVLPLLQSVGVGRRAFVLMAMLTTMVQFTGMASLSLSTVQALPKPALDAIPYVIQAIGVAIGPLMPCIRSTIASLAESDEMTASVAVSLGAIAALQTVMGFITPFIGMPIYVESEHSMPGLVFVLATVLVGVALAVALTLPNLERVGEPSAVRGASSSSERESLLSKTEGGGGKLIQ